MTQPPMLNPMPVPHTLPQVAASEPAREPVTILMVDDQPAKLLSYEVILKDLGERLVKATSGRDALDHLLRSDVAVVLMDVSMPEIDGFELADMMRQHPRFQKTPIIFVSAVHLTEVDRIRGYQSGAVDYISVPVIPEVLRAKVSVFAELHRKTRQLQELNRELEERVAERSEELRVANGQLQQRVAELESIMQVLPVGVAVAHDPACAVVTGNAAASEILGMKQGDNLAAVALATPSEVVEDGASLPTATPLEMAIKRGKPTGTMEIRLTPKDQEPRTLLTNASPLFDEEGNICGAVGAFLDISEQKNLEEALRERAELLELATEAIMVHDREGTIRFWNAGAEALYGWTREDACGKRSQELLQTEFPESLDAVNAELTRSGRWEGNLRHTTKDGRELVVASRQALKKNSAVVLAINRDITAELAAGEALKRSDRLAAMGKLAGIVAHEINNPLEAITNAFYLLNLHPSLDDEARYYAKMAEQELARVSHITRQTLSFYRESQQAIPISISTLLDDVLELQNRPMQMGKISLDKRYNVHIPVHGFPVELKQVFMNLIGNSIQAMPEGGRLRVRVKRAARGPGRTPGLHISICDTGCGIKPDHAKRLFEPFFSTKSTKGTGLGLWISKGIIEKHDGTLRFRTHFGASGTTTCFQIFIPTHEPIVQRNEPA
ncbi:MAG: PAS domain S-box protein [Acidobacteria bacterium]|nr:PAS domain S-box protein [Acidobacteriota bacterium]